MSKKNKNKSRVGEVHFTNEGYKITIIEYFGALNCTIQFEDGFLRNNVRYSHIETGSIRRIKTRVGEKLTTNEGYEVEIIEWFSTNNCTVQFENGFILKNITYRALSKGHLKNPYHPSVHGVGYTGVGKYVKRMKGESHDTPYSILWRTVLGKCCNEKIKKERPTYKMCTVAEEWKCLQNFGEWYENNWKPHMEGWQLDKDLLIKGNKLYSPETCCFLPQIINVAFSYSKSNKGNCPVGVHFNKSRNSYEAYLNEKSLGLRSTPEEAFILYKDNKEKHLRYLADEWKDKIMIEAYEAIYKWVVEITD